MVDTLITIGYYVSSIGFLIASIMMARSVSKFGKSALGSIFYYLFIGTVIFFAITVFQKLGADFFRIQDDSVDIWWHLMFYMSFFFWLTSVKLLVGLGSAENDTSLVKIGAEKMWAGLAAVVVIIFFIIPHSADGIVQLYVQSHLSELGLHHFIAFLLAGSVASYLVKAKKNLGQIGHAIANPLIITMWAFAGQHFWELLNESWKVIPIDSATGEGVEKIFLTIAAIGVIFAASRLSAFAKATSAPAAAAPAPVV